MTNKQEKTDRSLSAIENGDKPRLQKFGFLQHNGCSTSTYKLEINCHYTIVSRFRIPMRVPVGLGNWWLQYGRLFGTSEANFLHCQTNGFWRTVYSLHFKVFFFRRDNLHRRMELSFDQCQNARVGVQPIIWSSNLISINQWGSDSESLWLEIAASPKKRATDQQQKGDHDTQCYRHERGLFMSDRACMRIIHCDISSPLSKFCW